MNSIASWLGWALFIYCGVCFVGNHGIRWEFGPHGLPVTLVAPDGCHSLDGAEIDPLTLALVRSGMEEVVEFALLIVLGASLLLLVVWIRKLRCAQQEYRELCARDAP